MTIREELLAIREKRGSLTPDDVLEEAKPKSHPLHDQFEWNDRVAGHEYRLNQARRLLQVTFRVQVSGRPQNLRAFWAVRTTEGQPRQYVPQEEIALDPMQQRLILQQMRRDWQRFKGRYEVYQEFYDLLREEWPPELGDPPDFGDGNGTDG